jgi:pimeloyl-ACP methyl ester carboxylesterase
MTKSYRRVRADTKGESPLDNALARGLNARVVADMGSDPPDHGFQQLLIRIDALLEHLHIDRADLFGFSKGGTVALYAAIRHPKVVRRLVLASALFSREGADAAFWDTFAKATPDAMPKELRDAYLAVAPHPEDFERFFCKCVALMRDFRNIPREAIRAPAYHLRRCRYRASRTRSRSIPLDPAVATRVLPGTDHVHVTPRTQWLVPIIGQFLKI